MKSGIKGFTFVEVIFTVGLMCIVGLISFKSIAGMLHRIRLQNAGEGIKHYVKTARSRAISNPMVHCGVMFDVGAKKVYAFLDHSKPSNHTYDAGTDSLYMKSYFLKDNVVMTLPSGSFDHIAFRGDGSANTSNKVVFTLGNFVDTLSILASTGRVRLAVK